jgi:hypothetical protein
MRTYPNLLSLSPGSELFWDPLSFVLNGRCITTMTAIYDLPSVTNFYVIAISEILFIFYIEVPVLIEHLYRTGVWVPWDTVINNILYNWCPRRFLCLNSWFQRFRHKTKSKVRQVVRAALCNPISVKHCAGAPVSAWRHAGPGSKLIPDAFPVLLIRARTIQDGELML